MFSWYRWMIRWLRKKCQIERNKSVIKMTLENTNDAQPSCVGACEERRMKFRQVWVLWYWWNIWDSVPTNWWMVDGVGGCLTLKMITKMIAHVNYFVKSNEWFFFVLTVSFYKQNIISLRWTKQLKRAKRSKIFDRLTNKFWTISIRINIVRNHKKL
jgi:hypothetical protein